MMDKIVPMLPLYSPQSYIGTWSNLIGYDARWGIVDSLPRMSFNGLHEGQDSADEFRLANFNHRIILLDMFTDCPGTCNDFGIYIDENIVSISPDLAPTKTGLVFDWEQIDDFHFKYYMRDDVYWNPSYDITGRDKNSLPLNEIIHNGEYIIAHSVIYPYTGYFYDDDIIKYNYDLEVAEDWLSSIGYTVPTSTNIALSPIIIFAFVIFSLTLRKRVKKKKK